MNFEYFSDDLITALATPPGRGALAVIRVSGPGCIDKLSLVFSNGGKLKQSKGYRIHYGWFTDGTDRVDEVLISVFREPNSYTGQDSAEISCHGGPAVVKKY
jgi:tRNA modification GTPase